jgi:hypothetical protein
MVQWAAECLVRLILAFLSSSEFVQCGLSIKNNDNPRGLYTEQEIYNMFIVLVSNTRKSDVHSAHVLVVHIHF